MSTGKYGRDDILNWSLFFTDDSTLCQVANKHNKFIS